jgi:hypothetical protein
VSEFVDVEAVRVLDGYRLELTFSTGEVRELDVERYLWGPAFEPLRDPAEFPKVAVDPELGTIVWPNGAGLSPEELYAESTPARHRALSPIPPPRAGSRRSFGPHTERSCWPPSG